MNMDQASKYITLTWMWPSSYKFPLQKIGTVQEANEYKNEASEE
jgi:hypothetical protein